MATGPDFSEETKNTLAKRAAQLCSKPGCLTVTSGPHTDEAKAINLGEAAHIKGARKAPNNRFDPNMSDEERSNISNGIWLCRTHAKEIDSDEEKFSVELLHQWKEEHERAVLEGRRGVHAAREVNVKEDGVGSVIGNSGDGVGLEINHSGKNPAERIKVEGKGIGEIIVNTGSGAGKRIISTEGSTASETFVNATQPVNMAVGLSSTVVVTDCKNCGEVLRVSKVIQGFAGDVEPKVEAKCQRCGTSMWI
jgi:hypothetical protein